jgi:hypothetical protein
MKARYKKPAGAGNTDGQGDGQQQRASVLSYCSQISSGCQPAARPETADPLDLHDWADSALSDADRALALGNRVAAADLLGVARDALERAAQLVDLPADSRQLDRSSELLQMIGTNASPPLVSYGMGVIMQ